MPFFYYFSLHSFFFSFFSFHPCASRANQGGVGGRGCSVDESDRQRLISDFATRAIAAHRQCIANGGVLHNLPKSESSITFLSDENPLTIKNPIYHEDGTLSSPDTLGRSQRRRDLLGNFSPSRNGLREAWLRLSSTGGDVGFGGYSGSDSGWGSGGGHSWTLPSRLHRKEMYDALRRQVVMDPVQWELELLKAEFKDSKDAGLDSGFDRGLDSDLLGSPSLEPKLTVKEQARQFEQQAQEMRQRQNRDSQGSLSPDMLLSVFPESPLYQKRNASLNFPTVHIKEGPPSIIVTQSDGGTPPPSHKPTPPVLRRFGSNLTGNQCVDERLQVTLEVIPDPPSTPPPPPPPPSPPPPPPTTSAPPPPPPRQPSSPAPLPPLTPPPHHPSSPAPLHPPSPRPRQTSSLSPLNPPSPVPRHPSSPPPPPPTHSNHTERRTPPPPPPLPMHPPPPPPPLPPPLSPSLLRPSTFVLPSLSEAPTLRPVSLRPTPPPLPVEPEQPRRELKGILKNIQNIADIEKSVANMFSQIDQKQIPLKKVMKSHASMDSLDSLDSLDTLTTSGGGGEGGEGVKEGAGGGGEDLPLQQIQPNPKMNSIVEELEKRFPSQSTML
ncbi:protocadherin-15-like [Labrus bergylta]|uniref:protocadherin-15-like n=1 Tax=Labrus bergylta TaxID=56723 RepID=UPI003313D5D5